MACSASVGSRLLAWQRAPLRPAPSHARAAAPPRPAPPLIAPLQVSAPGRDLLKQMLERDPAKRVRAADALRHPWLQDADSASALPLRSSVVQRLQRFATYGHLKQLVLRLIADDMATHPTTQKESQVGVRAMRVGGSCGCRGGWRCGLLDGQQCVALPACTCSNLRHLLKTPSPNFTLTPLALFLSATTPQELIEGLTGLFEELDLNASGSVSMDELVSGLDRLGYDIRIDGGWAGGWVGKCALPALQASRCLLPVPALFLLSFPAFFLASPALPALQRWRS